MKLSKILLLVLMSISQFVNAQTHAAIGREFSSDEDFVEANSVRLPKNVLAVLLASKDAESGRDWIRRNPGKDGNDLFHGFSVNLSRTEEKDYIVVGNPQPGAIVSGADNDWFWVVHSSQSGPHIVLFCGALTVSVLPQTHNSLQDIRCAWESPGGDGFIHDYRFNSQRYVLFKKAETHRKP